MTTPKFVSIKTDAIEKVLSSSTLTGKEARIAIAYFVAAGNQPAISKLTGLHESIVKKSIIYLKRTLLQMLKWMLEQYLDGRRI